MTMRFDVSRLRLTVALLGMVIFGAIPPQAALAQTQGGPFNTGLVHFSGGVDAPTLYVYRGIRQEGDPTLTFTPWADLAICTSDTSRVCVETGIWSSLNTGSSGTGGPLDALHYSQQFHAALALQVGHSVVVTPGYLANSSPNGSYETIQEFNIKVESRGRFTPYGLAAFELVDSGQLDGGSGKGSYLEIGASPGFSFGRLVLDIPVKAGFSLKDYYELLGPNLQYADNRFGFAQAGGRLTYALSSGGTRVGQWKVRGGADVMTLGDTTRAFNLGKKTQVVGTIGISMVY